MGHEERPAAARQPVSRDNRPTDAALAQRAGASGHGVNGHGTSTRRGASRHGVHAAPAARGAPGAFALSNWPVAWRLFIVIVLAAAMGLIFGGLQVASAVRQANQFQRVTQLAQLGQQGLVLATDLENERAAAAVALSTTQTGVVQPKAMVAAMVKWWGTNPMLSSGAASGGVTGAAAARFSQLANAIGNSYPVSTQDLVGNVVQNAITFLPGLRATVESTGSAAPAGGQLNVMTEYAQPIASIFQLNDVIAQGSGDSQLINDVQALGSLSRAQDQLSQQRAILWAAFTNFQLNKGTYVHSTQTASDIPPIVQAISASQNEQNEFINLFFASANPAQTQQLENATGSQQAIQMGTDELYVIANGSLDLTPIATNGATWVKDSGIAVTEYGQVQSSLMQAIVNRSEALQAGAVRSAWTTGILTGVVFLLILLAALFVARSLVLPLRRLRAGAINIATVSLPEQVKALAEADSEDGPPPVEIVPVGVLSTDEIGQVARSFDLVHQEAVRLAGNEAMLRASLNAMFVSLSRRSQTLIERLSRMIDTLELNEDDPDRLSSLFSMDHMITRMRRNSENLLVLAGHEGSRKRSDPVLLGDVARAATSEIEQYGRVVLNIQPGIEVTGQASTDIIHLLAELIENATLYSPRTTDVFVTAQELSTGGVLLEVADSGVGISESRLEQLNWRLENPPVVDVSVSRHMGLFAVSRLAARHGVAVRLRPSNPRGLVAMVWLPHTVAARSSIGYGERLRRLGAGHTFREPGAPFEAYAELKYGDAEPRYGGLPSNEPALGISGPSASAYGLPQRGAPARLAAAQVAGPGNAIGAGDGAGMARGAATGQPTSNWFRPRAVVDGEARTTGWRHPQFSAAPESESAGVTGAGLPQRVPRSPRVLEHQQAQAVTAPLPTQPQQQPQQPQQAPQAVRSPEAARSRLGGFQHGSRRAEAQATRAGEGTDR
jgi:signal transduction histidine kinase